MVWHARSLPYHGGLPANAAAEESRGVAGVAFTRPRKIYRFALTTTLRMRRRW
jgi:hypothetical protein